MILNLLKRKWKREGLSLFKGGEEMKTFALKEEYREKLIWESDSIWVIIRDMIIFQVIGFSAIYFLINLLAWYVINYK